MKSFNAGYESYETKLCAAIDELKLALKNIKADQINIDSDYASNLPSADLQASLVELSTRIKALETALLK